MGRIGEFFVLAIFTRIIKRIKRNTARNIYISFWEKDKIEKISLEVEKEEKNENGIIEKWKGLWVRERRKKVSRIIDEGSK